MNSAIQTKEVPKNSSIKPVVVVGAGVFGGVASLTAAPGISPDRSPPQPAANKIDAIPNMSRASFNIFTLHTRGSMMCRMVSSQ